MPKGKETKVNSCYYDHYTHMLLFFIDRIHKTVVLSQISVGLNGEYSYLN